MYAPIEQLVQIPIEAGHIEGMLQVPANAQGLVLFAHGSGSSRHSPRNNTVAKVLRDTGIATLLTDLLTPQEDARYQTRFDIGLLTVRLLAVIQWLQAWTPPDGGPDLKALPIGFFGASTGAAAALEAAGHLGTRIGAVVSRGGRPDLAGLAQLEKVRSPTLLLVGGRDEAVIQLNCAAFKHLACIRELHIIPGATHLFEEPGALEQVAQRAAAWFRLYLRAR